MKQTIRKVVSLLAHAARKTATHPREAILSMRMALWIVLVSALVRLTTLARVQQIARCGIRSRPPVEPAVETPAKLARMLDSLLAIELLVFRRNCWKRALVLHRYLALNGIESQIRFGVRRESAGPVDGHAWLERNGEPLLEDNAASYVVTFSLPAEQALPGHSAGYH
jgi:hypothetical protein